MNEVVKKPSNLPATSDDLYDSFIDRAAVTDVTFVTYKKGAFGKGPGQVAVPMGSEFVPNVAEVKAGWLKWVSGKVVETRMVRIAEQRYPFRDELPDQDKAVWPVGASGQPQDPWAETYTLPLKDPDDGEEVVFTTSSVGGRGAVDKLVNAWKEAVRKGQTGLPVIALGTDSYQHDNYGWVHFPVFAYSTAASRTTSMSASASPR